MVRCFENDNIIHVNNKVDPADDIEVINTELALSDLDTCERAIHRVQKKAKGGDKDAKAELAALEKCLPQLENAGMLRALKTLTDEDKAAIKYLSFLTLKPTMYIANVNEDGFENNPYLDKVREIAAAEGSVVVAVCAAVEADIAELPTSTKTVLKITRTSIKCAKSRLPKVLLWLPFAQPLKLTSQNSMMLTVKNSWLKWVWKSRA